jgi:hypothetical protein
VWLELCLDAGIPYQEYIKQPLWIIETHRERFYAKGSK